MKKRINIYKVLGIRHIENMFIGGMLQNLNIIRGFKICTKFLGLGLFIKSWWKILKKKKEEKEREKRFSTFRGGYGEPLTPDELEDLH